MVKIKISFYPIDIPSEDYRLLLRGGGERSLDLPLRGLGSRLGGLRDLPLGGEFLSSGKELFS